MREAEQTILHRMLRSAHVGEHEQERELQAPGER